MVIWCSLLDTMPHIFLLYHTGECLRDDSCNTLSAQQAFVGGYIELAYIEHEYLEYVLMEHCGYKLDTTREIDVILNEEGGLQQLPSNAIVPQFFGNAIVVIH